MTYDAGAGGHYELLLEMPISAAHMMQVTGREEYLLIVSGWVLTAQPIVFMNFPAV